eukprot:gene10421-2948_t
MKQPKKLRPTDKPFDQNEVDLELMLYTTMKVQQRKRTYFGIVFYVIFLLLTINYFLFSTFIVTGDQYWLNYTLKFDILRRPSPNQDVTKNFYEIGVHAEFWDWVHDNIATSLFNDVDISGQPLPANERRYLSTHNKLFGSLRFRQIRVGGNKEGTCVNMLPNFGVVNGTSVYDQFEQVCYPPFDERYISSSPVGGTASYPTVENPGTMYKYGTCEENGGGVPFIGFGRLTTYPCSGHAAFVSFNESSAVGAKFFQDLQSNYFVDIATRIVLIEYFVYNANLNYFVSIKNSVEWTAGGQAVPSWDYRIFKLEVLRTTVDYIQFSLAVLLPLFVAFYIYQYFEGLYLAYVDYKDGHASHWINYIISPWNLISAINYGLFTVSFILKLVWWSHPDRSKFQITDTKYPHLDEIALVYSLDTQVMGVIALFTILILFRYMEISEENNILVRTFITGFGKIIATAFITFYTLLTFGWAYYMSFGFQLEGFKDIFYSLLTLFRILLGEIDYGDLRNANRYLAAILYILFVIIGFFLVLNMFLAVTKDTFSDVIEDQSIGNEPIVLEIFNFLWGKLGKVKDNISETIFGEDPETIYSKSIPKENKFDQGDHKILDILSAYQEANEGAQLTIQDLKKSLGKGASFELVARIMDRFDRDKDGTIDVKEIAEASKTTDITALEEDKYLEEEAKRHEKEILERIKEESLKSIGISKESKSDKQKKVYEKIDELAAKIDLISKLVNKI